MFIIAILKLIFGLALLGVITTAIVIPSYYVYKCLRNLFDNFKIIKKPVGVLLFTIGTILLLLTIGIIPNSIPDKYALFFIPIGVGLCITGHQLERGKRVFLFIKRSKHQRLKLDVFIQLSMLMVYYFAITETPLKAIWREYKGECMAVISLICLVAFWFYRLKGNYLTLNPKVITLKKEKRLYPTASKFYQPESGIKYLIRNMLSKKRNHIEYYHTIELLNHTNGHAASLEEMSFLYTNHPLNQQGKSISEDKVIVMPATNYVVISFSGKNAKITKNVHQILNWIEDQSDFAILGSTLYCQDMTGTGFAPSSVKKIKIHFPIEICR